jgi:hypothetical protein
MGIVLLIIGITLVSISLAITFIYQFFRDINTTVVHWILFILGIVFLFLGYKILRTEKIV